MEDRIRELAKTVDFKIAVDFLEQKYETHHAENVIQAASKPDYGATREAAGLLKGIRFIISAARKLGE